MINSQIESVRRHLQKQYSGVLSEQQIDRHIHDYIGLSIAEQQVADVLAGGKVEQLLDIGCGFGSFVLAARQKGIDAIGIDIANFEIQFARERLHILRPQENPENIYQLGTGISLPFSDEQFDVVTLWNILEHIPDDQVLLQEVSRILRPNGRVYIVCPNYAAFRSEAHYHLFWVPILPRSVAIEYLRFRGRNPSFFESNIFYRTNWGVIQALYRNGFELYPDDLLIFKLMNFDSTDKPAITLILKIFKKLRLMGFVRMTLRFQLYNPFKHSVTLYAFKKEKKL
ncbi:MAG: class I SAM-dependent methyltransferase [Methanoregula sp.]